MHCGMALRHCSTSSPHRHSSLQLRWTMVLRHGRRPHRCLNCPAWQPSVRAPRDAIDVALQQWPGKQQPAIDIQSFCCMSMHTLSDHPEMQVINPSVLYSAWCPLQMQRWSWHAAPVEPACRVAIKQHQSRQPRVSGGMSAWRASTSAEGSRQVTCHIVRIHHLAVAKPSGPCWSELCSQACVCLGRRSGLWQLDGVGIVRHPCCRAAAEGGSTAAELRCSSGKPAAAHCRWSSDAGVARLCFSELTCVMVALAACTLCTFIPARQLVHRSH